MEPALTDVFQWFLIAVVAAVFSIVVWLVPLRLYIEALSAGVHVGFGNLIGMRLRKVIPSGVVRPLITATKAGIDLDINQLEAHYLAGGDVHRVVGALISADKASIELEFNQAAAIDLAGGLASGEEAVRGQGPWGYLDAIGFTYRHAGQVFHFSGRPTLLLYAEPANG